MDMPGISSSWLKFLGSLNEAQLRWCAAEKALELGRGGITRVRQATGLSQTTITKAIRELEAVGPLPDVEKVRRAGGGRKKSEVADPMITKALEAIVSESTAGDPMGALKWTVKSSRTLASELKSRGHEVGPDTVCRLLHEMDYSLQGNQKKLEGSQHPDRDSQFRHISRQAARFAAGGDPVISVDTKKKELVGEFKNAGQTYRPKGSPEPVNTHDFRHKAVGMAVPYGLYDPQRNHGMVNVGTSKDTAEFAVESIRQWWHRIGMEHYPKATRLLICADGGGSNSSRSRAWRANLQKLADETGLTVSVSHYPPGTSKWNKIEHKMFSFISINWKGKPLRTYEAVVNLIGNTTTKSGLRVEARLDTNDYKTGVKVSKEEMDSLNIKNHARHPQWNYTIQPRVDPVHGR